MERSVAGKQVIDFGDMPDSFYLIGLLNEFMNRFQAVGDSCMGEISWKQTFLLNCIQFFRFPPTIKEISEMVGSSHQNIKQMLLKLEKTGYVRMVQDEEDRRKVRIMLTEKTYEFSISKRQESLDYMLEMFSPVSPEDLKTTIKTITQLDEKLKKMKETLGI